ncbi:MAG: hypothetical protein ACOH1I_10945 [Gallionellaceae bacterium]|jgi:multidrug efflux pump subunit AcrB
MKNCKLSWILVGVLLVIVAMFAYKFTVGEVAPSEDGRMAVILNKNEHNALMKEMRNWLQSSQSILAAATANDFDTVSKVATAAGMIAEADVPGPLFRKIPLEMKALGFDTRKKFDQIAADAVKLKDSNHTVAQLSVAMKNCIACHATYSFVSKD